MIGDRSKNQEATWEFLDRRLDDVVEAGININMVISLIFFNFNRQGIWLMH